MTNDPARPWGIGYRFPHADHRISKPLDNPRLRVLSLGAGLQSSTLAWMSARGDLPRVDFAVFADTGWEPRAVYDYLAWMEPQLPFPVIRVKRDGRDLGALAIAAAEGEVPHSGSPLPPWFTAEPKGMMRKHCSKEFKARPVGRFIREQLGLAPRQHGPKTPVVEQWLGMTTDEMERLKYAERSYTLNRWPLMEFGMTRDDCATWLMERQIRLPPKSSCVFCPYRRNDQWRDMRDNHPLDWEIAVAVDSAIRAGYAGMEGEAFVHPARVPLSDVDLSPAVDPDFGFDCDDHCST